MSVSNIEPELKSLESRLSDEIANDRKEIDVLRKRISKNEALLRAIREALSESRSPVKSSGYGSQSKLIRDAISRISSPRFTQSDIELEIQKSNPTVAINRERIRATLWTFAKKKHELITQVTEGSSRQPAEFEKLAATPIGFRFDEENPRHVSESVPQQPKINISESGRRKYGASKDAIIEALKKAAGVPLKASQIVKLSGTSFPTANRILRKLEDQERVRRQDDGLWTLIN